MSSIFEAIAKESRISLDTLDVEDRKFFKDQYDLTFVNATSNQGICYGNWLKHPEVIQQAVELAKKKQAKDFLEQVLFYAIAISGRNQLQGLKECVLSQIRPLYASDEEKTFQYALGIINAYEDIGVDRSRVIIKIPVTWESMQAARRLVNEEHVKCLGTVVHSFEQGVIAAEAGCTYISPYVDTFSEVLDPSTFTDILPDKNYGVLITRKLHKYYRAYGVKTQICVAALLGYRTVIAMSGVDGMTLSPTILNKVLSMKVPKGEKIPALAETYTAEEAGPKVSFIDDKDGYYARFNSNKTAVERYDEVAKFFTSMEEKSKLLIRGIIKELE